MGLRGELPPEAILVTPQAPFPGGPWGYGGGWAWYQFLGGTTPEPQSFEAGQELLERFLDELQTALSVQPGPKVIGGFSQGGTSALAYALRHPGQFDGVLVLSGFLASHPSVKATPETVGGTRFFWGHGTLDQVIPASTGRPGRQALLAAGAELESHDYPIGHWVEPDEMRDVSAWTQRLFASAPALAEKG